MLSFIITCFSFLLSRFSYFFSFITKEESVEAETDEKPSENVVATKSIPESTDVTSTPDTTKELEAPQQEKEDVKEEKEAKESPKEEPKEGDLI